MGNPVARLTMPMSSDWTRRTRWRSCDVGDHDGGDDAAVGVADGRQLRRREFAQGTDARARAFVGAYLAVWIVFSLVATAAQWAFQRADWVNPMIVSTSGPLTPHCWSSRASTSSRRSKRVCLSGCRTPIGFLLGEWRPGAAGRGRWACATALLSAGCCWALMALLFVGGAMNLAWVVALSIVVAIEKLAPKGDRVALALGVVLIAAGAAKLAMLLA